MKKWELARYLIDAKKCIDSIIFIEMNVSLLQSINPRDRINSHRRQFYINCRTIIDNTFTVSDKKAMRSNDKLLESILYETNKNQAHKDKDYIPMKFDSLSELIEIMVSQLEHCKFICSKVLPDNLTLDYIPHDRELFRVLNGITPTIEEQIKKDRHPLYKQDIQGDFVKEVLAFHDTEDIREVTNPNDYGVMLEEGINVFEGLQNRQDWCIKVNVLFDLNVWAHFNESLNNV